MVFRNHRYQWSKPFTSIRHEWSLVGPSAALSFHVTIHEQYGDSAGLEIHYFNPPASMKDQAPMLLDCPYTGGRCWHSGTSLYAMETLWPMIRYELQSGDHEAIFTILETELERRVREDVGE